jgi:hypothetical protein
MAAESSRYWQKDGRKRDITLVELSGGTAALSS